MFISSTFTDTAQERNLLIADGSCLSDVFVMTVHVLNRPIKVFIFLVMLKFTGHESRDGHLFGALDSWSPGTSVAVLSF